MGNDTKRLIKESLIGLLNDKPFDGICIKELTRCLWDKQKHILLSLS